MKYEIILNKKGEKDVYGIFRPEGMNFGKNGIRKKLCTRDDLVYKQTKSGKRKRSEREQDLFLRKLWEQKMREILDSREKKNEDKMLFSEAAQMFYDEKQLEGSIAPYTLNAYLRAFEVYIEAVGNHPINNFKKSNRAKLIDVLRTKKTRNKHGAVLKTTLTPVTINTYLTKLNSFFIWCYENGLIDHQHKIKRLKVERKKKTAYTDEHQEAIENLLFTLLEDAPREKKIIYLTLLRAYMIISETGMRLSEVWSLRLSRIKLNDGYIEVRSVPEVNFKIKERAEKNVWISNYLQEFLKYDLSYRNGHEQWYLDNGNGQLHYKKPYMVTRAFRDLQKRHNLNVPEIKPWHGFRSRAISIMIRERGIMYAKELAGHSQLSTTEAYVDTELLDLREAVNVFRNPSKFTVPKLPSKETYKNQGDT